MSTDLITTYQKRYTLANPDQKLVDNRGEGHGPLYGLRNFRFVLNGLVYRGGANNAYNKTKVRDNSNPLPDEGLNNLCREGFGRVVYLYPTRFETAPKETSCQTFAGATNKLDYRQISPLVNDTNSRKILQLVHESITGKDQRPVYLHCWNGWHASGFISSLILRQYCGFSGEQAVSYWNKNTDGNNKGASYEKIRQRIRAYSPDPKLSISPELKAKLCPEPPKA